MKKPTIILALLFSAGFALNTAQAHGKQGHRGHNYHDPPPQRHHARHAPGSHRHGDRGYSRRGAGHAIGVNYQYGGSWAYGAGHYPHCGHYPSYPVGHRSRVDVNVTYHGRW